MPNSAWARAVIFLAAGFWLVLALVLGAPVDQTWLRYLGITASGAVMLLLAFDLFVWRWLPLWLVKRPNLRGTWKATLRSNWVDTAGTPTERKCYIVVHQTYSKICVEMLFASSDSISTSANIVQGDGRPTLWYAYRSEAHALSRDGNPPHRGAVMLHIETSPRVRLSGDYWTERGTTGRLEIAGHSKKVAGSFHSAEALDYA